MRLRAIRIEQARTQASVAADVGICVSHLSQIEAGLRRPSLGVLGRLCGALGCEDQIPEIVKEVASASNRRQLAPVERDAARGAA